MRKNKYDYQMHSTDTWGVQVGVVSLIGGLFMSFSGQLIHYWSPPDTQHSPVAPRCYLHVIMATPQAMVLTGCLNQVRVTGKYQTLGELGPCLFQHTKTFPVDWAEETT